MRTKTDGFRETARLISSTTKLSRHRGTFDGQGHGGWGRTWRYDEGSFRHWLCPTSARAITIRRLEEQNRPASHLSCLCAALDTKPLAISTWTLESLLTTHFSILLVMFRLPSSPPLNPGTVILSPLTRFLPVRSRSSWCHPVTSLPWSTTSASQGHSPRRLRSSLPPAKIPASQRHFYRNFTSTMPEMAAKRRLGECRKSCGSLFCCNSTYLYHEA